MCATAEFLQILSWLQCSDPWNWTDDMRCSTLIRCSGLRATEQDICLTTPVDIYNRTIFIDCCIKYLSPAHPRHMADQYGFTPEDYIDDMNILSHERYSQGMLFLILLFFKRRLKPFQVIVATLMVYDFIYHIPQQVRLSICK